MQLLPFLLALAYLSRPGWSSPCAQEVGRGGKIVGSVDGGRERTHHIEPSPTKLQKRGGSDPDWMQYDGRLGTIFKEAVKRLYLATGRAVPSLCVLECLSGHSVHLSVTGRAPTDVDNFLAYLHHWEDGCKRICGDNGPGPGHGPTPPTPESRTTTTETKVKTMWLTPKVVGNPNLNFRLLPAGARPMRAAQAAIRRLGALVGGWRRSAPGWEKWAARAVRSAEMESSMP
ncbi:MAG: hypothetical protein M1826_004661 [Phylliscum demangeonii]|nr:MAG: hypothetical protein M1826_004661 [Phylliscum demangeonii]